MPDIQTKVGCSGDCVFIADKLSDLYAADRTGRFSLLCQQQALLTPAVRSAFAGPHWAVDLFDRLILPARAAWLFAESQLEERASRPADRETIACASGLLGAPSGAVRCTWSIRTYYEKASRDGDLAWWRKVRAINAGTEGVASALIDAIIALLEQAKASGAEIIIEQLSIILNKDKGSAIKTLTPVLHADEYYGVRESGIASLLEEGWNDAGGTLFLPYNTMADFDPERTIDMTTLAREFAAFPIFGTQSGDVCIYDGMLPMDGGAPQRARGIPHISADQPGRSARLVLLMRHRAPETVSGTIRR